MRIVQAPDRGIVALESREAENRASVARSGERIALVPYLHFCDASVLHLERVQMKDDATHPIDRLSDLFHPQPIRTCGVRLTVVGGRKEIAFALRRAGDVERVG